MSKKNEKEKNKFFNYFIYLIFLGLLILVYSHFIGTKGLFIREYAVSSNKLPKSFDGFKIVHFTDLHYGTTIKNKEMEKLINEISDLKPDIVVFTGDLIDQHYNIKEDEVITLANYFNRIDAKIGKYIVNGNHDISKEYYRVSGLNKIKLMIFDFEQEMVVEKDNNQKEFKSEVENIITNFKLKLPTAMDKDGNDPSIKVNKFFSSYYINLKY